MQCIIEHGKRNTITLRGYLHVNCWMLISATVIFTTMYSLKDNFCRSIMQLHILFNFVHFCSLFTGVWCLFDIISASEHGEVPTRKYIHSTAIGLLTDTQTCLLRMHRECRERFLRHRLQRKMLISDPGMHHGTCDMRVPLCMSGSLTRGGGENVLGISGACATRNFTYLARDPWGSETIWGFLLFLAPFLVDAMHSC